MDFTDNELAIIKAALLVYDMQLVKKITDDNFDAILREMDRVEAIYNKIIINIDNLFS
jgi:hypothetical protein